MTGGHRWPDPPPTVGTRVPEIWLAPNAGSEDLTGLWRRPRKWADLREYVTTVQLYAQNLRGPFDEIHARLVGGNTWVDLARSGIGERWGAMGVRLAIEAASLKPGQHVEDNTEAVMQAIRNCRRAGLSPEIVMMDEPAAAAKRMGMSFDDAAHALVPFEGSVRDAGVLVGCIEPWPLLTASEHAEWFAALDGHRFELSAYHLDIDVRHGRQEHERDYQWIKALQGVTSGVSECCRHSATPFGVIVPGFAHGVTTDAEFCGAGRKLARDIKGAAPNVDRIIVQSWQGEEGEARTIPRNLPPEGDTLTALAGYVASKWGEGS